MSLLIALAGVVVAVVSLARARYTQLKAEDARRIEHKVDALRDALAEAAGHERALQNVPSSAIGEFRDLSVAATRSDLARVERKLDAMVRALGLEQKLWPPISAEVQQLLSQGDRIAAIRQYREEHPGLGLREAKEILEWTQAEG